MHTHYSMFGFSDSPQYVFYHILPFFNSYMKKIFYIFFKIYVVKSLHNVVAVDFFNSEYKKAKYGKIHIVGSLTNQT